MDEKIRREAAEEEVQGWCELFGGELDLGIREKIVQGFMAGRITCDIKSEAFTVHLLKPIRLENGKTIDSLKIGEPDFDQINNSERAKNEVEQTMFLLSSVTGHPVGVIGRLKMRDLTLCGSVLGFFG